MYSSVAVRLSPPYRLECLSMIRRISAFAELYTLSRNVSKFSPNSLRSPWCATASCRSVTTASLLSAQLPMFIVMRPVLLSNIPLALSRLPAPRSAGLSTMSTLFRCSLPAMSSTALRISCLRASSACSRASSLARTSFSDFTPKAFDSSG